MFFQQPIDGGFSVRGNHGLMSLGLEIEEQSLGEMGFIFDDQDATGDPIVWIASGSSVARIGAIVAQKSLRFYGCNRRGNCTVMVAPLPSPSLVAVASPPCWRAMVRTKNSPRPVPLVRNTVMLGTR